MPKSTWDKFAPSLTSLLTMEVFRPLPRKSDSSMESQRKLVFSLRLPIERSSSPEQAITLQTIVTKASQNWFSRASKREMGLLTRPSLSVLECLELVPTSERKRRSLQEQRAGPWRPKRHDSRATMGTKKLMVLRVPITTSLITRLTQLRSTKKCSPSVKALNPHASKSRPLSKCLRSGLALRVMNSKR